MTNEIPLEKHAEELFRIAGRVAARGEPYMGGNRFSGISGGQRYTLDHNFWDCDHRLVFISGPNLGVSVDYDRDNSHYPDKERSGYSIRVWQGSMPENLIEILEGLEPDRGKIASDTRRNKTSDELRDNPFASFLEKDRILAQLGSRDAAWEVKQHGAFLPFWVKDKYKK